MCRDDLVEQLGAAADDRDGRAGVGEGLGEPPAEPGGGAGEQDDSAIEAEQVGGTGHGTVRSIAGTVDIIVYLLKIIE